VDVAGTDISSSLSLPGSSKYLFLIFQDINIFKAKSIIVRF